jgi:hypothetical protein
MRFTRAHAHACMHSTWYALSHAHTRTSARTHTLTYTYTHKHTHTHTNTRKSAVYRSFVGVRTATSHTHACTHARALTQATVNRIASKSGCTRPYSEDIAFIKLLDLETPTTRCTRARCRSSAATKGCAMFARLCLCACDRPGGLVSQAPAAPFSHQSSGEKKGGGMADCFHFPIAAW